MEKLKMLLVAIVMFFVYQNIFGVKVSDLDEETQKAILSYSSDIKEVEEITWEDVEENGDPHIYYQTDDYIIIIIDGKIYIVKK